MPLRIDTVSIRRSTYVARELSRWAALDLARLPFRTELSLAPLIDFYRASAAAPGMGAVRLVAERIEAAVARHPELLRPFAAPEALGPHRDVLELLMSAIFPPALRDREMGAALVPFEFRTFYCTPLFAHLLAPEGGNISGRVNLDLHTFTYGKVLSAYLHILSTVYGIDVPFDYPVVFTVADPETGLDRHFRITNDLRFVRVEPVGRVPPLNEKKRRALLNNLSDLSFWHALFPPDCFRFSGFGILHADEVTEHRVVSLLETDLVHGDRLLGGQSFALLAERLRTLLGAPQIEMGLAAVEEQQLLLLDEPSTVSGRGLRRPTSRFDLDQLERSLFRRCMEQRTMLIVEDLAASSDESVVEERLRQAGVRTLILAPLLSQNEAIGVLYVWAREPGLLHALNVMKLQEALPLFAAAVRRGLEALRSQVRNVIMGEYTAIHPTVEWRFRRAALAYIERQEQGLPVRVEPIVFDEVVPLFSTTDIRASSTHRNEAVRLDLLGHLDLAAEVLQAAAPPLPVPAGLPAQLDRHRQALCRGFTSGGETAVRDFLRLDVDPVLDALRRADPGLEARITDYHHRADPETGVLYRRIRAFEQSVTVLNETISNYLDGEQAKVQACYPHYFEKHQTDGVAFSLYVGPSLLESRTFDPVSVPLLRFWQLVVMCGIARRAMALRETLEVPLETTHLLLVQHTPVSIRFRFDETRFDVAGAQHIRYEIMKQRVEKATLRDSDERVTQPDRLAIVYAQEREGEEYARYVAMLQERGLLEADVESCTVADLPGMPGLRALRVRVAADAPLERSEVDPDELADEIRALPALV